MNTTRSLPRRIVTATYGALKVVATVSAPIAAIYGHLAWVETRSSSIQEEERLVLQRAMLTALERMLPEAERTRLGIEGLVKLLDRRIEMVREKRRRLKAGVQPSPQLDATSSWSPDSPASTKAKEIFDKMDRP
jgi:hypothetical protein